MTIIFTRQTDDTTLDIMKWIDSAGKKTFRINSIYDIEKLQDFIKNDKIKSIYFNGIGLLRDKISTDDNSMQYQIENYLDEDNQIIWEYLFSMLKNKKTFGLMPYSHKINKLKVLSKAEGIGFLIPPFKLINNKQDLLKTKNEWGRIICKSLGDGINIITEEILINGQKTEEITSEDIHSFTQTFYPTFVQKLIEKKFEVRVFYFLKKIYSIAIFTQSNIKSQIDGRIIDSQMPQRKVPFTLPHSLHIKIIQFMEELDLTYGSIDFIFSKENEFYFLEVNPYGQYGFLSEAGNYYIEKEIAEFLCK